MTIPRNLSFLAEGASSTGVLSVTFGGTGLTSLSTGYIPYGNGTGAFSSSSNLFYNGNLGIGTNTPQGPLSVSNSGAAGFEFYPTAPGGGTGTYIQSYNRSGGAYVDTYYYAASHTWRTNTSATSMVLASNGIVTMSAYGAGAATFSSSGVISSVSDETWKVKDGVPTDTDVMLQKLEPGYWYYNDEKKLIFGEDRQLGFYAQNVNEAIGNEAAPIPEKDKPWGYYDRSVLAVVVISLKNALSTIEELKQRIIALEAK